MQKPLILVVDDEPINLKLVAECLNADYQLRFARSAQEGLTYLQNNRVDLILLDIVMPEMDGFAMTEAIHHLTMPSASTPIIYLTGDNSELTVSHAFDAGAVDYIVKPFRQKELIARVKNRIETEMLKITQSNLLAYNQHLLSIIDRYVAYIKTDTRGIITGVSERISSMFGCHSDDLIGKNVNTLKSGKMDQQAYRTLWRTIESGDQFSYEVEDINFTGGTNWYEVTITPDFNDSRAIIGYIAFYVNIDDRVNYAKNAKTDHLTQLHNRASLDERLESELLRSQRYGEPLSVIMADIDFFKSVNDTFGHDIGDAVLKDFAHLLAQNVRKTDFVARFGGEEFMILCTNTTAQHANILAEALRHRIEEYPFEVVGHKTASFGVAQYQKGMDAKQLFLAVDRALYDAKESGRNRVMVYNNA